MGDEFKKMLYNVRCIVIKIFYSKHTNTFTSHCVSQSTHITHSLKKKRIKNHLDPSVDSDSDLASVLDRIDSNC